ncbi:MAG TPA: hypothetical protein VEC38_13165 [Candidatus Binataceae bacterium]|nr:hypothetical protein [Candidatus Binataceae bacterium]
MKFQSLPLTAIVLVLFSVTAPVRAEDLGSPLCVVEASSMEDVAKDRDTGKPETVAHAEQNGRIDNEIVALIYETRQYSPQQERDAILKVCAQTDGFAHGVGVPDNADIDKIDASILQAIRIQLAQH